MSTFSVIYVDMKCLGWDIRTYWLTDRVTKCCSFKSCSMQLKTRIYTYPHPPSFFTFYLPALQYCQNGSDQQMKVFAIYFPSFVFGKLCEINHMGSCNTLSILKFSDETQTVRRLKMLAQQKFDICIRGTSNKNSHGVESYQMSSPKLVQDRWN